MKLSHLLPPFRSNRDLAINNAFLIGKNKNLILRNLQFGFRASWASEMPPTNSIPHNFLRDKKALMKARARFSQEVKKGRMLGGVGWTLDKVERFLKKKVYVIPCGAVPKNDDPYGRIIHDYSFPKKKFRIDQLRPNGHLRWIHYFQRESVKIIPSWLVYKSWFKKWLQAIACSPDWLAYPNLFPRAKRILHWYYHALREGQFFPRFLHLDHNMV